MIRAAGGQGEGLHRLPDNQSGASAAPRPAARGPAARLPPQKHLERITSRLGGAVAPARGLYLLAGPGREARGRRIHGGARRAHGGPLAAPARAARRLQPAGAAQAHAPSAGGQGRMIADTQSGRRGCGGERSRLRCAARGSPLWASALGRQPGAAGPPARLHMPPRRAIECYTLCALRGLGSGLREAGVRVIRGTGGRIAAPGAGGPRKGNGVLGGPRAQGGGCSRACTFL